MVFMVERLFLAVPRGCLQFVIVAFPDHTHYFSCGILDQVWYLIVSFPDLCRLSYVNYTSFAGTNKTSQTVMSVSLFIDFHKLRGLFKYECK